MAFVTVEDMTGGIETIVFPKTYELSKTLLLAGNVVLIKGRLSLKEDEDAKIVVDTIENAPENVQKKKKTGMFLRLQSQSSPQAFKCNELLQGRGGKLPVYFYFNDTKQYRAMNYSVDPDELLLSQLRSLLGNENVVIQ